MTITLQINGTAIDDIVGLYAEINRVFMAGEDCSSGRAWMRWMTCCMAAMARWPATRRPH